MRNENFIYLSDGKNSPYGEKTHSEVLAFTEKNIEILLEYNCKAIVLACNTATAVAVEDMRKKYKNINIVGLEPALRRPAEEHPGSDSLVLATPTTLSENRFVKLKNELTKEGSMNFFCIGAQYLVEYVENKGINRDIVIEKLKVDLKKYRNIKFKTCVLGCTHFPFAKYEITEALGYSPIFYDGGKGAAQRLKYLLSRDGIENTSDVEGNIIVTDTKLLCRAERYLCK